MQRAMIFIDYENFEIARQIHCRNMHREEPGYSVPWLDLVKLPAQIVKAISCDYALIKTFLFVPEPDEFLMQDQSRKKRYDWLKGLENRDHFAVITGRHVARANGEARSNTRNINDKATYHIDEKGTDVNIAVHLLTKAFHNSFDIAIVVSGDTDYIPVYDTLSTMGKTVVVVGVKDQNLSKLKNHSDRQLIVDEALFNKCLRPQQKAEE